MFLHFHAVVRLSALTGLWERFANFQTQHRVLTIQQGTFRIMKTTAATARNTRLIAEVIITSHTGIAYHLEHTVMVKARRRTTVLVY